MAKNTTPKKPKPLPPVLELTAWSTEQPTVLPKGAGFQVTVEGRVLQGINAVKNIEVIIRKDNGTQIFRGPTDSTGLVVHTINFPATDAGKTINLRMRLAKQKDESALTVSLPQASVEPFKDPEKIRLRSCFIDANGLARISLRVIMEAGRALKTTVNLNIHGRDYKVKTNELGHATFKMPLTVDPGKTVEVFATVDGISKECVLKVHNPLPKQKVTFLTKLACMFKKPFFWILFLPSLPLSILTLIGTIIILGRSFSDRLASGEHAYDILWLLVIIPSILWFALFFVFLVYSLFIKHNVIAVAQHVKEKNSNHSSSAGDSMLENFEEFLDEFKKPKKSSVNVANVDAEPESSGSVPKKLGGFLGNFSWSKLLGVEIVGETLAKMLTGAALKVVKLFR